MSAMLDDAPVNCFIISFQTCVNFVWAVVSKKTISGKAVGRWVGRHRLLWLANRYILVDFC